MSADVAAALSNGALSGFYLASDSDAAAYFGALSGSTAILQYTIANSALAALIAGGSILGSVPQLGAPFELPGTQLFIPPTLFPQFDTLRSSGGIIVSPYNWQ